MLLKVVVQELVPTCSITVATFTAATIGGLKIRGFSYSFMKQCSVYFIYTSLQNLLGSSITLWQLHSGLQMKIDARVPYMCQYSKYNK